MNRKRSLLIAVPIVGLWFLAGSLAKLSYKASLVAAAVSVDKALADYLHSIPPVLGWTAFMIMVLSLWIVAAVIYAAKKI